MKTRISLLLCLLLLFGIAGCAAGPVKTVSEKTKTVMAEETTAEEETAMTLQNPEETAAEPLVPEYSRFDGEAFVAKCAELEKLAEGEDADAVIALYDELFESFCRASDLYSASYIEYSCNVTDAYWTEESELSANLVTECGDALCSACQKITDGPCADAFRAYVGDGDADSYAAYMGYTDEEQALFEREQELIREYYAAYDAGGSLCFTYDGHEYTVDEYNAMADELYERDYDTYYAVGMGLMAEQNRVLGEIFVELVAVRSSIAEAEGYDNYSDYAYENLYERDYTPEQAMDYCREVKENIAREFHNDTQWFGYADCDTDSGTLLAQLGECAAGIGGTVCSAWEYMTENGLYDIGSDDGRMEGAYTTAFEISGAPFIFETTDGSSWSFQALTHEFGHFVNCWLDRNPNVLLNAGNYDLFEIHSTGMEILCLPYYTEFFGEDAEYAAAQVLYDKLDSVVYGCIFDEFQQRVYESPDMTLDDINRLFCEICRSYGVYEDTDTDYTWVYVSHNFESPLYYISYSVSSLAALQLWQESQTDYQAAADDWLNLAETGAYGKGYCEVLEDCGLQCFTESGTATAVCRPALDYLESF